MPRQYGIVGVGVSVLLLEVIMLVVYFIVADPIFKWKAFRTILEQIGLVTAATLLALLVKPMLQSSGPMHLLGAFIAALFGVLVFVCANLVIDKELRQTVLGKVFKRR